MRPVRLERTVTAQPARRGEGWNTNWPGANLDRRRRVPQGRDSGWVEQRSSPPGSSSENPAQAAGFLLFAFQTIGSLTAAVIFYAVCLKQQRLLRLPCSFAPLYPTFLDFRRTASGQKLKSGISGLALCKKTSSTAQPGIQKSLLTSYNNSANTRRAKA